MTTPVGIGFTFPTSQITTLIFSEHIGNSSNVYLFDCVFVGIEITITGDKVSKVNEGKQQDYFPCSYLNRDDKLEYGFISVNSVPVAA